MKITILILLPAPVQQEQEGSLQASSAWLHTPSQPDGESKSAGRREHRAGTHGRRSLPPGVGQN